jgi:hypothetical protein
MSDNGKGAKRSSRRIIGRTGAKRASQQTRTEEQKAAAIAANPAATGPQPIETVPFVATPSSGSNPPANTTPPGSASPTSNPTIDKANAAKSYLKGVGGKGEGGNILKYPANLLNEVEDYLKIDICEYEPALAAVQGAGSTLATFMTYMPRNIATNYAQDWGKTTLTPNGRIAISAIQQGLNGASGSTVGNYLQGALRGTETTFAAGRVAAGIQSLAQGTSNLNAQSILGLTSGIGINNTVEMFWNGHGDNRTFGFTIEMSPKNEVESRKIREIVKMFKVSMHPGSNGNSAASAVQSRFVTYPFMMKLKYMRGTSEHEFLHQFKPCVLQSMSVNYTPQGVYSSLPNSSPTATTMTLAFKEIKMLYREDILESKGAGF